MMAWARGASVLGALASLMVLGACAVESPPTYTSASGGGGGWAGSSGSGGSSSGSSQAPGLVVVDTNAVMTAAGGQGVGVFVEYKTGGHWHVSWTCDTKKTGLGCSFDNSVSVESGAVTNAAAQGFTGTDALTSPSAMLVEAVTQTTTEIEGITFDTAPGAVVTLDARLSGTEEGSILFFVQDGVVNGGYTGAFANPLMLQPSSP